MATPQPKWEIIANLGDANPLDYGGYFIYKDKTGVYGEEAELLALDDESDEDSTYVIYRILLDRLKLVDGYLVPFKYDPSWPHPLKRYDQWFHEGLADVASSVGATKEELERSFTSADPIERAHAYRAVGNYHGWENLDSYPMRRMTRNQVEDRYHGDLKRLRGGPKKWSPRG